MLELVIPARNEARRLPRTLAQLRTYLAATPVAGGVEVVVVDNRCTDDTAEVARAASSVELPVRVVRCTTPGKGAAVRAGLLATTADVVGFMDADGATDMAAIADGLGHLALGADVVTASRAVPGCVVEVRHSALRESGATLYRRLTARIVPDVVDTQCGFKLIRGELARDVANELHTTGFSFDVELLARFDRRGAKLVEFPVVWNDVPGSTFKPALHGLGAFWELTRISRLVGPASAVRSSRARSVMQSSRRPARRIEVAPTLEVVAATDEVARAVVAES